MDTFIFLVGELFRTKYEVCVIGIVVAVVVDDGFDDDDFMKNEVRFKKGKIKKKVGRSWYKTFTRL